MIYTSMWTYDSGTTEQKKKNCESKMQKIQIQMSNFR